MPFYCGGVGRVRLCLDSSNSLRSLNCGPLVRANQTGFFALTGLGERAPRIEMICDLGYMIERTLRETNDSPAGGLMTSSAKETGKGTVTSLDGTRIGFQRRGSGPGVVLIQGAMGTAFNYEELADALASSFTVYTPDRRGRGMSPKRYEPEHVIARDVEDVDALLAETGAGQIFGLSSGGMIALEATRTLGRVKKAAIYEPPFYAAGIDSDLIRQFNTELDRGDLASAMVSAGRIVGLAPAPVKILPKSIARQLTGAVIRSNDKDSSPHAKLRDLIPTMPYDFNDVSSMQGKIERMASIDKPVLLLSGTKSPAYLRQSVRSLARIIPGSKHIEFSGLDHSGAWNVSRGGHPETVAAALRDFFS